MGLNLGDTTFSVLGTGAEFTAVCEAPDDVSAGDVKHGLEALPEAEGARVEVRRSGLDPVADPSGASPIASMCAAATGPDWWHAWPKFSGNTKPISCA